MRRSSKQRHTLSKVRPPMLVATSGRPWEMVSAYFFSSIQGRGQAVKPEICKGYIITVYTPSNETILLMKCTDPRIHVSLRFQNGNIAARSSQKLDRYPWASSSLTSHLSNCCFSTLCEVVEQGSYTSDRAHSTSVPGNERDGPDNRTGFLPSFSANL